MRNRESEGHTDSAVEDSARAPLLSRRRVHKTFPLKSLSWLAVLTVRALSTRSSAAIRQQRRGCRVAGQGHPEVGRGPAGQAYTLAADALGA